jgi:lipopolysaccharide/colanic/teichoic acid biosynthesis glycosyltransferase
MHTLSEIEIIIQDYLYLNGVCMKRFFDLLFSSLIILLFGIPLLLLALLIRYKLGSPIFFTQARAGLHGKPFQILKFRSMTNDCGNNGQLLPDELRLTDFSRWLRSTSLDEIPSLWNVVKGDMSLVGPRPLLLQYLSRYSPEQSRRHEVLPGITGWAQVNGRNEISWQKKFDLDVWYVGNRSILLDIKILLITVFKIFKREGTNALETEIMPEFEGNDNFGFIEILENKRNERLK